MYPTKTLPESTCGAHRVRKRFALTANRPTHAPWRPGPSDFSASIFLNLYFSVLLPCTTLQQPIAAAAEGPALVLLTRTRNLMRASELAPTAIFMLQAGPVFPMVPLPFL